MTAFTRNALRVVSGMVLLCCSSRALYAEAVTVSVDLKPGGVAMKPIWNFFGYDEPNYTYMKDGRELVSKLTALDSGPVFFRCHSLLSTGDGTPALKWGSTNAYTEDAAGKPVYDWTIVDRIFDTYLKAGGKPYVQIGFMPEALSTRPTPYQHHWTPGGTAPLDTGWAYPPKDYDKWRELCRQWTLHSVEKYGKAEVESWYWEVWNEPNIMYWHGTAQEYQKLYDYAVDGVRLALPTARVGGSEAAGMGNAKTVEFQKKFFDHCLHEKNFATGKIGSPLDFISFHAKGAPKVVDGHVRMGCSNQLHDISKGFELIAGYPELKDKPIVIGESDPDGCAACPGTLYPQNAYRNGTLYAAYTAATLSREFELNDKFGVNLTGALTWAFEFEDQPAFAGFRVLSTQGIDLPVLNTFRLFAKMKGARQSVTSSGAVDLDTMVRHGVRDRTDVSALASSDADHVYVLLWNYQDDDLPGPAAQVELKLNGLPPGATPTTTTAFAGKCFRIDDQHANAFTQWKAMGSPPQPSPEQLVELKKAAVLVEEDIRPVVSTGKSATLKFDLPLQGIVLVVLNKQ